MFLSYNNIFTFISEDLTRYILYLEYLKCYNKVVTGVANKI